MKNLKKTLAAIAALTMVTASMSGCGSSEDKSSGSTASSSGESVSSSSVSEESNVEMSNEERIISAAQEGKVGNWGLGNEYEILALLTKYGQDTTYLSQSFDMDGFDDGSITLASAMTYNELGLVVNDYEGGYGYGDTVGTIDMNDEGVAMLEDNLLCTKEFAESNPNTVKA